MHGWLLILIGVPVGLLVGQFWARLIRRGIVRVLDVAVARQCRSRPGDDRPIQRPIHREVR